MQKIKLQIHNIGNSGEGVGSLDGYTIFVDGALPGEIVEANLIERHKNYGRAELLSIIKASPDRIQPICPVFGKCGGCQLMHLAYERQLDVKQQRVLDALQRIGKLKDVKVERCIPSPNQFGYRNKIQLPVRENSGSTQLGLYARNSHQLIEIDNCFIHCSTGEDIFQKIKHVIRHSQIAPFDPLTGLGELRHVLIKSAVNTNDALVVLVTTGEATPQLKAIAKEIMTSCPRVKGVIHNINRANNNVILGRRYHLLEGVEAITERLCGLTFKVSAASFFQVNPPQAEQLYQKALEYADLTGKETILDAYCGVGTLSLFFARHAKEVIGVECVAEAIKDAQENAKDNHIANASFVCSSSEAFIEKLSEIDVILLNPPRKGCEKSFLEGIKKLHPNKVIYISCDPATLARDLCDLHSFGYKINAVQPFDMFPQTAHVETVVQLKFM